MLLLLRPHPNGMPAISPGCEATRGSRLLLGTPILEGSQHVSPLAFRERARVRADPIRPYAVRLCGASVFVA